MFVSLKTQKSNWKYQEVCSVPCSPHRYKQKAGAHRVVWKTFCKNCWNSRFETWRGGDVCNRVENGQETTAITSDSKVSIRYLLKARHGRRTPREIRTSVIFYTRHIIREWNDVPEEVFWREREFRSSEMLVGGAEGGVCQVCLYISGWRRVEFQAGTPRRRT